MLSLGKKNEKKCIYSMLQSSPHDILELLLILDDDVPSIVHKSNNDMRK